MFEHEVSATQVVEKNEIHLTSIVLSVSITFDVIETYGVSIQQLVHCSHILMLSSFCIIKHKVSVTVSFANF